jgi:hypothetical protein
MKDFIIPTASDYLANTGIIESILKIEKGNQRHPVKITEEHPEQS